MAKTDRWEKYLLDGVSSKKPTDSLADDHEKRYDLEKKVDLRKYFGPVLDQGAGVRTSLACVMAAIAEYTQRRCYPEAPAARLSARYIHYMARLREKAEGGGDSISMWNGVLAMNTATPAEQDWPWDVTKLDEAPPSKLNDKSVEIGGHTIITHAGWKDPYGLMRDINAGWATVFSFTGPADLLREAGMTGHMPEWTVRESGKNKPGHPMIVVGHDLNEGVYIIRNSFGADWGDNGHCTIKMNTFPNVTENYFNHSPLPSGDWRVDAPPPERNLSRGADDSVSASSRLEGLRKEIADDLSKKSEASRTSIRDRLRAQEDELARKRGK